MNDFLDCPLLPELSHPLYDPQLHKHSPITTVPYFVVINTLLHGLSHPQDLEPLKGGGHVFIAASPAPGKVPGTEASKLLEGWDGIGWTEEQTLHVVVLRFQGETSPNNFEPQSHLWLLYLQNELFRMTKIPWHNI